MTVRLRYSPQLFFEIRNFACEVRQDKGGKPPGRNLCPDCDCWEASCLTQKPLSRSDRPALCKTKATVERNASAKFGAYIKVGLWRGSQAHIRSIERMERVRYACLRLFHLRQFSTSDSPLTSQWLGKFIIHATEMTGGGVPQKAILARRRKKFKGQERQLVPDTDAQARAMKHRRPYRTERAGAFMRH